MMTDLEDRFKKLFGSPLTDEAADAKDEPPKKEKRVDWEDYWDPDEIEKMLMD